jgi:hypothetical protein
MHNCPTWTPAPKRLEITEDFVCDGADRGRVDRSLSPELIRKIFSEVGEGENKMKKKLFIVL